ncbi:HDGF like 3 [Phyllostomus discolor]|uniref:HDGF like 3 n=1 Tax=Phyllostomus discolor TaxID=89673 RepID=A0A833YNH4_9CHIR|nr:HDGF like 3 [Phyllostomus discolor]
MRMTRTAKKRRTKAARRAGTPAMTRETQVQTRRRPAKGPNHRHGAALREAAERACVCLSTTRFRVSRHGPRRPDAAAVGAHVTHSPLCLCLGKGKKKTF